MKSNAKSTKLKILVTGGAGFIGSAVIRHLINDTNHSVVNVDKLTYAGNLENLASLKEDKRHVFIKGDICDSSLIISLFAKFKPRAIINFAAESHVDRSIESPRQFIETNIIGTFNLLNSALNVYRKNKNQADYFFKFHHISTDEVYGDLGDSKQLFEEYSSYNPSSPYAASKASSDHLVRSWGRTYNFPYVITNCSNNYGPYQFPEKLIPNTIIKALTGNDISVYGDGSQIRDWLYVDDHIKAIMRVALEANDAESYNIGGYNEIKNIDVVNAICKILDSKVTNKPNSLASFKDLIRYVPDRPGHDTRYAINAEKITNDLNWMPDEDFESGIIKTVQWYIDNQDWWENILNNAHQS